MSIIVRTELIMRRAKLIINVLLLKGHDKYFFFHPFSSTNTYFTYNAIKRSYIVIKGF